MLPGVAHHVTQRGNNRQEVFFTGEDRAIYLKRLFGYCRHYRVKVLAYCLMPNHIHVVAVPEGEKGLAKVFGRLQSDYARYANLKVGGIGHLWQERFYSCPMDDAHTLRAMAYIERNPLRAGMIAKAGEFAWSSAAAHLRGYDEQDRLDFRLWSTCYTPERWATALETGLEEELWRERLKEAGQRGLPIGDSEWVRQIELGCGRDLSFRRPGRPARVAMSAGARSMPE